MRPSRTLLRRLSVTAVSGCALSMAGHHAAQNKGDEDAIAQLRKQADKARQRAQERIRLGPHEMLGMTPKLWLEALDENHRYGSNLHQYWQRWEASRTRWMFFDWLDHGRGALIDLPTCPRRLLEEGKVLYLTRAQLKLCEVRIQDGLLVWCSDGEPVTLPTPAQTPREQAIATLIEERLTISRRRERLLRDARAKVADAVRRGQPATPAALAELTAPLVVGWVERWSSRSHVCLRGGVFASPDGAWSPVTSPDLPGGGGPAARTTRPALPRARRGDAVRAI